MIASFPSTINNRGLSVRLQILDGFGHLAVVSDDTSADRHTVCEFGCGGAGRQDSTFASKW